jgi:hypothetical protein
MFQNNDSDMTRTAYLSVMLLYFSVLLWEMPNMN